MKQLLLTAAISLPAILAGAAWTPSTSLRGTEPLPHEDEDGDEDEDAVKEEKVRELFELTHAREVFERNLEQSLEAFEDMPMLPDGFIELFHDRFDVDHMMDLAVPVYVEHLELDTIEAAIAFYSTEEGAKFAEAQVDIAVEMVAIGQKYGAELGMEVAEELR